MLKILTFILILNIGILTMFSDLTQRKIKNAHLFLTITVAIIVYTITFIINKTLPTQQLLSTLLAVIISATLYHNKSWRSGDAKLFSTYAFLMPTTEYAAAFPLTCMPLFINTFLLGFLFIMPVFVWIMITSPKSLLQEITIIKRPKNIVIAFLTMLAISWIIPLLLTKNHIHFRPLTQYIVTTTLYYLLFGLTSRLEKFPFIVIPIIITGLYFGIHLSPDFYTLEHISRTITSLCIYSLCSKIIHNFIQINKHNNDRIPFAPFLFTGCLLSYTPFLSWAIKILHK